MVATHFDQCDLQSEVLFKGASWNLKRLYDHVEKRYSPLKRCKGKMLSPSQRLFWGNRRLLNSFLYLQSLCSSEEIQGGQGDGPGPVGSGRLLSLSFLCPSDPSQSSTDRRPPREALCVSQTSSSSTRGSLPREYAQPEENRLTAAQASGNLHLDPSQHVNTWIQAELQKEKLTPEMAIHRDRSQGAKDYGGATRLFSPSVGPHHSKSQKSHRLSYVSGEGYNLEASFPSCYDSGETDDGEHTSLSSQVCSETTSETSSDTSDEEE